VNPRSLISCETEENSRESVEYAGTEESVEDAGHEPIRLAVIILQRNLIVYMSRLPVRIELGRFLEATLRVRKSLRRFLGSPALISCGKES